MPATGSSDWAGGAVGEYAAARRVVFGLVALGLVVPAALGPAWARAWMTGPRNAQRRIVETCFWLWNLALPAAVGLSLTVAPLTTTVLSEAGPGDAGIASGINNAVARVSGLIAIAVIGMIGTIVSCTLVAYGFARFRFPGRSILFTLLIATIFLPGAVTLVPTYTIFAVSQRGAEQLVSK